MTDSFKNELKAILWDIARYWEPRRLVYNVLLLFLTLRDFADDIALERLTEPRILFILAVWAVGANVCFCSAYLLDFTLRATPWVRIWLKARWALFFIGCWLAAFIAHQQLGLLTGGNRMA